jgi:ATP phosphoribosyltransferase
MNGAVELAPRLQIASFVCDLVSTGATLEANGLRPVETVLESEAVLIRTSKPMADVKVDQAGRLVSRIDGVLATKESKYIMLNAPSEALREITDILPGAEAPTILPLHGRPGHFAVHAVCQESVFWETLQKLKGAGASAILVLPIEKMMM